MASLTLTIPDAQLPRLVAAVAQQTGQDASNMTTPQKIAMVKSDITQFLIGRVQASEIPSVQSAATAIRIADIASNITVT